MANQGNGDGWGSHVPTANLLDLPPPDTASAPGGFTPLDHRSIMDMDVEETDLYSASNTTDVKADTSHTTGREVDDQSFELVPESDRTIRSLTEGAATGSFVNFKQKVFMSHVPPFVTEEKLREIFNTEEFGFGEILDICLDPEIHTAVITFACEEVAKLVRRKRFLKLSGVTISVHQLVEPGGQLSSIGNLGGGPLTDMSLFGRVEERGDDVRFTPDDRDAGTGEFGDVSHLELASVHVPPSDHHLSSSGSETLSNSSRSSSTDDLTSGNVNSVLRPTKPLTNPASDTDGRHGSRGHGYNNDTLFPSSMLENNNTPVPLVGDLLTSGSSNTSSTKPLVTGSGSGLAGLQPVSGGSTSGHLTGVTGSERPTVLVSGISPSSTKESLGKFFVNVRKSGGGPVVSLDYNPDSHTARVTFQEMAVVERVLQKPHLKLDGALLKATIADEEAAEENKGDQLGLTDRDADSRNVVTTQPVSSSPPPDTTRRDVTETPAPGRGDNADVTGLAPTPDVRTKIPNKREPTDAVGDNVMEAARVANNPQLLVKGIKPTTAHETLQFFFENKRRTGGGEVEKIERGENGTTAVITYKDAACAASVYAKHKEKRLQLDGCTLDVEIYKHTPPKLETATPKLNIVEISGLHDITTRDTIEFYFENTRRSGGGEIEKVDYKPGSGSALICFKDAAVAERVVGRTDLKLDGNLLTADWFKPDIETPPTPESDPRVVMVTGLNPKVSDETLQYFLENRRRNGGGPVISVERKDETVAIVTFEDAADAERVCGKTDLKLEGCEVNVSPWIPEPVAPPVEEAGPSKTIWMHGLPRTVSKDVITYFCENPRVGGGPVEDVIINDGVISITFENPEDAENLLQKESLMFEGQPLTMTWPDPVSPTPEAPEPQPPRSIVVSGFKSTTNTELVKMFFENKKRSGGGKIEEFTHNAGQGTAIITFEDPDTVESVLSKKGLKLEGCDLEVTLADVQPGDGPGTPGPVSVVGAVEVSGFAENEKINEELLRLYFENKRSTGGGEIKAINFDKEKGVAAITFINPLDATEVVTKAGAAPLRLSGTTLQVRPLEMEVPARSCAVMVTGFAADTGGDLLQMFFENRRRSGGDPIADFHYDVDNRKAIITYESIDVAERVVQKQPLTLDNCTMAVKMLQPARPPRPVPGPLDKDKILAGCLPPDHQPQDLSMYLSQPSGTQVKQVSYSLREGLAMLEFEDIPDFDAMRTHVSLRPFKGQMITVQHVALPSSVQVHDIAGVKEDLLMLYFENEKRSGGGQVSKINFDKDKEFAIVSFEDRSVLRRVMTKSHTLNKKQLGLSVYYDCMGVTPPGVDTSLPPASVPDHVDVADTDPDVLRFIIDNHRKKVEQIMAQADAYVEWPNNPALPVRFTCALKRSDPNFTAAVKEWSNIVEQTWHNTVLQKYTKITVQTLQELWEKFLETAGDLNSYEKDKIQIAVHDSICSVIVWGLDDAVYKVTNKLQQMETKLQGDMEMAKKAVTETTKLKHHQSVMLKAIGFETVETKTFPDLSMTITNKDITFRGLPTTITTAKLHMYEIINTMVSQTHPDAPESVCRLLKKPPIRAHLVSLFKASGMRMVWDAFKRDLTVWALNQEDLNKGMKLLIQEVIQAKLTVPEEGKKVLLAGKWQELRKSLLDRYPDSLEITVSDDLTIVMVAALRQQCHVIIEEVQNFLGENTILEKVQAIDTTKMTYMKKCHTADIRKIVQELKSCLVDIQFRTENDESYIVILGNRSGQPNAEKRVMELVKLIVSVDYNVSKPGMGRYFAGKRGKDFITLQESRNNVVIELITDADKEKSRRSRVISATNNNKDRTFSKTRLQNGTMLLVALGNLTTMKVDAIVNAANEELAHYGGLAKAISDQGGRTIQDECTAHVKSVGKLLPGHVYVSAAGKLPCTRIIHAVGPKWQGGARNEENELYEAVYTSMERAVAAGFTTLAFPAIGSGVFGVPAPVSAKTIVSAVKDFCEAETDAATVKEVHLVDNREKVVNHLHEALHAAVGEELELVDVGGKPSTSRTRTPSGNKGKRPPTSPGGATSADNKEKTPYTKVDDTTVKTSGGIKVKLIKGGIEAQQVDVIVNSTSKDMNMGSGVSKALAAQAGPALVAEAQGKVPLGHGSIAVTSGHRLKCKKVFHCNCGNWDGTGGKCSKNIKRTISECLKQTTATGFASIAFPAIGSGNNAVPHDECAKTMYAEVAKFSEANKGGCVKDVRFVIFPSDQKTLAAFEAECRRQANLPGAGGAGGRRKMKSETESPIPEPSLSGATGGGTAGVLPSSGNLTGVQLTLKNVKLELELGDITQESTDAIVNSTDPKIDLSSGGVAKAMSTAGGRSFVAECKKAVDNGDMQSGICITRAGKLKASHVIHIAAPSKKKDWKSIIQKTLKLAESNNLSSVTFPALGTGQRSMDSSYMASTLLDAIAEFAEKSPRNMNLVRIVIFSGQPHILDVFREEIMQKSKTGKKKSMWTYFKEAFIGGSTDEFTAQRGAEASPEVKILPAPMAPVTLRICGGSQASLDRVVSEIEEVCVQECKDKLLDSPQDRENIEKLDDLQIAKIQSLDQVHPVRITIEIKHKMRRIRLQGPSEDIASVMQKIYQVFLEANKSEHRRDKGELVKKQVQWYFEEGSDMEEYPDDINVKIEEAFEKQQPSVFWEEEGGMQFTIDFKKMEENQIKGAGPGVKVKRMTKGTGGSGVELPSDWSPCDPNKVFEMVQVPPGSAEFADVQKKMLATASGQVTNFIKIERLQNRSLYQKYAVHKDAMTRDNPGATVENVLWHGTAGDTLDSINRYGFNRSYCGRNGTALGNGVYFAKSAQYSCGYAKAGAGGQRHMYMTTVLTGAYTQGASGMRVPPTKSGTILYDSVVDNVANPSVFVIFSDTQAYPGYLITFT